MKLKILGPPGCGKTTRLMEILENELHSGVQPERIAFLTFTRAAREEALARIEKKETEFPYLRTIHSICYRQLGIAQSQIVKPRDLKTFGVSIGIKINGNLADPWVEEHERSWEPPTRDDLLLQTNHCGRHRGILLKEALQNASMEIDYKYAVWFTRAYKNWKTSNGKLDYTDLLMRYIDHGKPLDIDTMFVDEAQDLSLLQWDVVNKLGSRARQHYIAGDDDQAIFNWAGADSSVFQNLNTDQVEVLGQSYRVSKSIHEVATKIARRMKSRLEKEYKPTELLGEVSNVGYLRMVDFKDKTFVLFRNHFRGQELARQLNEEDIPFIGNGSPLNNENIRTALMCWYYLIKQDEVPTWMAKKMFKYVDDNYTVTEFKKKSIKKKSLTMADIFIERPRWTDWEILLPHMPARDLIRRYIKRVGFLNTARPQTELLSIHQSKGREADTVILDIEISRAVYDASLTNPDDEHRCWYVAVTRAKKRLLVLLPDGSYCYRL